MAAAKKLEAFIQNFDKQTITRDVKQALQSMRSLRNLQKTQLQADKTNVVQKVGLMIPKLVQSLRYSMPSLNSEGLKALDGQLKRIRTNFLPFMRQNSKKQLDSLINEQQANYVSKKNEQQQQKIAQNVEKNEIIKLSKDQQQLITTIGGQNNSILKQHPFYGIQDQIGQVKQLLSLTPESIGLSANLPQSVQLLDKYAMSQGYLGIGPTTQNPGRAYIGRQKMKLGQNQIILPFPKNKIPGGQTPNIANNFKYFAGKTINSWNDFVKDQNNLIQYVQKVATKDLRKKYIQQKLTQMNASTFKAQVLATLTYYYVQIPMQNFLRYNSSRYTGSYQSFIQNYQVGSTRTKNPLLLTAAQGVQVAQQLFVTQSPQIVLTKVLTLLSGFVNVLNKQKLQEIKKYVNRKLSEAKAYYNNIGVSDTQAVQMLSKKNIVNIKQRAFILPSMFTNSQIVQIMQKIKSGQKKQKNKQQWSLTWQAPKMMSHDYIWNFDL